jgi:two-component system, OmpR family, sensor kinase
MRSIERTLLGWIMGALLLGSVVVSLVAYFVTLEEMNEVFDADLKTVAEALSSYQHSSRNLAEGTALQLPQRTDVPEDIEIVTLTWTAKGQAVYSSDPRVKMPYGNVEGLAQMRVESEDWIVYTSVREGGVAQAAQRVASRNEMARESAVKVFPPMMLLVVIVGALLVYGLRRGLRSLNEAALDIAKRSTTALEPLDTRDMPHEIAPFVESINGMIGRVGAAISAQRQFLADAAHELRTPVTAQRLQLQLLQRSTGEASRQEAMAELEAGITRSQRLIEQLLHVARSGPEGDVRPLQLVDLGEVVQDVVGSLSAKADQHGIDLGASAARDIVVKGDREQLALLLENLVENSLRYAPEGSVVDVEVGWRDDRAELRVIDNGPGIPDAERERVFARFFRGEDAAQRSRDKTGSGLGLAIVRAIADRHGASVGLHTPASGQGLEVRVAWPQSVAP